MIWKIKVSPFFSILSSFPFRHFTEYSISKLHDENSTKYWNFLNFCRYTLRISVLSENGKSSKLNYLRSGHFKRSPQLFTARKLKIHVTYVHINVNINFLCIYESPCMKEAFHLTKGTNRLERSKGRIKLLSRIFSSGGDIIQLRVHLYALTRKPLNVLNTVQVSLARSSEARFHRGCFENSCAEYAAS